MKITCQSCHSKYNVADEKVQGKIVKIRCRKCGATIVVNGTGGASAGTNGTNGTNSTNSATEDAGAGGGAQWHVNIGDNDQRTMTMPELVDAYNAGVVTQETFIWTDGMDDWRPLAEVEPVVSALHASAGQNAVGTTGAFETPGLDAAAAAAAAPMAAAHISEAPPSMEGDPYGGGAAYAAAAPVAEPRRAAVAKRETRGRDLFGTNVGDEIQTSAPAVPEAMAAAPAAGGGGLTGQRNENSVLFSLAVLTKNADQRAPQNETTANKEEDSGLIDLKALAAKAESVRPPARAADGDVFTAPIGGLGPPLGAPVGALSPLGTPETQQKSKLPLYIGAGGGVLVLLVLGIVIGVKLAAPSPVPAAVSVAATIAPPTATVDPSAMASASAAPDTSASAAPSASAAAKPKFGVGGAGGGGVHPPPRPGAGGAVVGGGGGGGATPPPAPAPKPKGGGDCGCNGDLMCLMKCSTH
jgi:predicted Zn finger-like uncharacterized protein